MTGRHSLTNYLKTMYLRERGLLHEMLTFATSLADFNDLFVAKDPNAASDDPIKNEFAERNHYALKSTYRDIARNVEFPDDDNASIVSL